MTDSDRRAAHRRGCRADLHLVLSERIRDTGKIGQEIKTAVVAGTTPVRKDLGKNFSKPILISVLYISVDFDSSFSCKPWFVFIGTQNGQH
jgi:hypothetical protein